MALSVESCFEYSMTTRLVYYYAVMSLRSIAGLLGFSGSVDVVVAMALTVLRMSSLLRLLLLLVAPLSSSSLLL